MDSTNFVDSNLWGYKYNQEHVDLQQHSSRWDVGGISLIAWGMAAAILHLQHLITCMTTSFLSRDTN